MGTYIIKVQNTSGVNGTIIADAGFSYTDNLNEVNQGQIKITGTGAVKRNLLEIGSQVWIYRNGTLEFHGIINGMSNLNAGGIAADLLGYEVWLGKENGNYAGSPWSSTASATIASAIIAESNYFTGGTIEAGSSIDFSLEASSSLWNGLSSLINRTGQDIGIDYSDSTVDILNHKGSSTSVITLNDGIQIQDLTVRSSYPIGNDVRVYGKSEGETRIVSDHTTYGQDATSKATYGTIRKIYQDASVITQAEANVLANQLVAQYKNPTKVYEFDLVNPNKSIVSGDVVTLNSSTKGLSNEEVRVVGIERGIRNNQEFMTLEVTNKEYSKRSKQITAFIAELQKTANDMATYDQYGGEYSNQNCTTCIGAIMCANPSTGLVCINGGCSFCIGSLLYADNSSCQLCLDSGRIYTGDAINIGSSSLFNYIGANPVSGCGVVVTDLVTPSLGCDAATKAYVDACVASGGGTIDGTGSANTITGWVDSDTICATGIVIGTGEIYPNSSFSWGRSADRWQGLYSTTGNFSSTLTVSGTISHTGCIATSCIGIGGSSSDELYVAGDATITSSLNVTYSDTTCTYASRRLKLPVGTNCY